MRVLASFILYCIFILHSNVFAAPVRKSVSEVVSAYTERALKMLSMESKQKCDFKCQNSSSIPTPSSSWTPLYNGCGTAETFSLLPKYNFTSCCNLHDLCYSSCGKSKTLCDLEFLTCMIDRCDASVFELPVLPPIPEIQPYNISSSNTSSVENTTSIMNSSIYEIQNSPIVNSFYLAMMMYNSQNAELFNVTNSLKHTGKNYTFEDADKYDTSTYNVVILHRDYLKTGQKLVRTRPHRCPLEARLFHLAVAGFGCEAYLESQNLACQCI